MAKISRIFSLGFLGCKHSVPAWILSAFVHFTWIWSLLSLFDKAGPDNMPYFHVIWACLWVVASLALLLFVYHTSIKWAHALFMDVTYDDVSVSKNAKAAGKFARAGIADKFFAVSVGMLGLLYLIAASIQYASPGPIGAGGAMGGNQVLSVLSGIPNQTMTPTSVYQTRRFVAQKSVDLIGFFFSVITLVIFYIPWYQVSLMSKRASIAAGITSATPLNATTHEMTQLDSVSTSNTAPPTSGSSGTGGYRLNAPLKARV